MKRINYYILTASIFIFIACQNNDQEATQQAPPATYPVVEIPAKTVTGYTSYPVSIEGTVNSQIRAKVSGYITNVLVDEGEKVRKGQALFKLETETMTQDAGAARANVNAARVEVNKLEPLVEKGIISQVQLETAKAKLAQAEAAYNSVQATIGYSNIKSPVDGYVGSINYREGALVSPGDPTPLTIVSDIDNVYAFYSMNERDYLNFLQNTEGNNLTEKINNFPPVQLQLVNGQVYEHEGRIQTVTGQVNESTGTVSFRALFPNPNRFLTNGNSGNILIPKTYENVAVVPEAATFEQQGRVYVYKVQGDTLAVSSSITITDRVDKVVVVESGIRPGEKIVVQGVGKIRNNTPINPQPVAFDSIANSLNVVFK